MSQLRMPVSLCHDGHAQPEDQQTGQVERYWLASSAAVLAHQQQRFWLVLTDPPLNPCRGLMGMMGRGSGGDPAVGED